MRIIVALVALMFPVVAWSASASEKAAEALELELKDARQFLIVLHAMRSKAEVENAMARRVKVGDSVLQHRALLGGATRVRLNPYSNRFVFTYEQDGREHYSGGQGFWVLSIETDLDSKVARVWSGVAKK
jgi:hypothetical protein